MKAVIMAGGRGTRFWPVSRRERPKQFIGWGGGQSLFQQTLGRLSPHIVAGDTWVVCPPGYSEIVLEQAPGLGSEQLIVEPVARNTGPALALAAWHLGRLEPQAMLAVLAADHMIRDVEALHEALQTAAAVANEGWLVTFGLKPAFPATGYGYLEQGPALGAGPGSGPVHEVERFIEKPDLERAQEFVSSEKHFWNSGMFVWRSDVFLEAVRRWLPEVAAGLDSIDWQTASPERQLEVFSTFEPISVDHGIMEQADRVAMVACDLGWSDVGSWDAAADLELMGDGSQSGRRIVTVDSRNCLVEVPAGKVAALVGVDDLVVVDSGDALLICRRGQSQALREVMEQLEESDWTDVL